MSVRWVVVAAAAVLLVLTPVAVAARPVTDSELSATELTARIQASVATGWSGSARTSGTLQIPESDSFATLGELLGETTDLRVWWRNPQEWRVDRLRGSGETDLIRSRGELIRWVFESERAVITPVSQIRLPDASDLVPPTLGRTVLRGARPEEVSRLPAQRWAGREAPGLRLRPADAATTLDHVDLWADADTGLTVRVEVYGRGDRLPVVTATMTELTAGMPDTSSTTFRPAPAVTLQFDQSVDVAAAANATAPYDLPARLAGFPTRTGEDPGAVGIYGRGPTLLFVLPLRGSVAGPLRQRLSASPAATQTAAGTSVPLGPVNVLLAPVRGRGGGLLLAGTVTPATLDRAAAELAGQPR